MTKQISTRRAVVAFTVILSFGFGSIPALASDGGDRELVPYIAAQIQTGAEVDSARALVTAEKAAAEVRKAGKGIGGVSPMVIPAAAFSSKGNDASSAYFSVPTGYWRGNSLPGGCLQAGVYLPQGALITSIYASMYDNDPAATVSVTLTRTSNTEIHQYSDIATLATSSNSTDMQTAGDTSIDHPVVDYPAYTYWVSTCLASVDTRLYSVRVYFDNDGVFADGFESGGSSAWTSTVE